MLVKCDGCGRELRSVWALTVRPPLPDGALIPVTYDLCEPCALEATGRLLVNQDQQEKLEFDG